MSTLQIAIYVIVLIPAATCLGEHLARVYAGERTFLGPVLGCLERGLLRILGVPASEELTWKDYGRALLLFNLVCFVVVYALQRLQQLLPWNPLGFGPVAPDSAFNTAVSFATNTNWQGYGGESTLSYATQMLALTVQNFVSAATGMAVLVALTRGFARRGATTIGSFWVDLVRSVVHVLLPLSLVLAIALVARGVVQTLDGPARVELLDPQAGVDGVLITEQTIPLGPAASQVAIKQLGTNGGGFYAANSAHPLENPDPISNFLQALSILWIPAALCITFGALVRDRRQGYALLAAMLAVLVPCMLLVEVFESAGTPALIAAGAGLESDPGMTGGNLEGKEVRFGVAQSAIWVVATTAASNGSVNCMHDSLTPLGGLVPMVLMQIGEVIFGGVGSGLYGMLVFAIVTVFLCGLMVGRTPEYLGKKIGAFEMKMASLAILGPCLATLGGAAFASALDAGRVGVQDPGAHGFSEILYAFSSAGNNNGSAFGGLAADTPFYNVTLGVAMLIARYLPIVAVLALAGSLARKTAVPVGPGTLPTHTPLFVLLLLGTVLLVGALTFVPALALGPIADHLQTCSR
ncbi:MAG: potassium-transporting ATPase subunit KdpA [Planctomycetes bacterium]|nr:potassium-transporting ATPase subunit KdpA [Planctomycetota bacterium]